MDSNQREFILLRADGMSFDKIATKLKVSKFNRFIISIQDEFESTKEIYIYLQESRTKFVTKTTCDIEFLGRLIYSFYLEGMKVLLATLPTFTSCANSFLAF